jgi:hypothetical protein
MQSAELHTRKGWRWADTGAEGCMVGLIHPLEKRVSQFVLLRVHRELSMVERWYGTTFAPMQD